MTVRLTKGEASMLRLCASWGDRFPWPEIQADLHRPSMPECLDWAMYFRMGQALIDKGLVTGDGPGGDSGEITELGRQALKEMDR